MTYPQSTEYHSAVQSPEICFVDPELRSGTVRSTPLGLPHALSGGFALTYTVQNGAKKFAVRCFHREVPDLQNRYEVISKRLRTLNNKFFVDFDYENQGIKVNNKKFPIVKMRWVEGKTLGDYISKNVNERSKLKALRDQFRELNDFLVSENVAHGDIQDLNVVVSNDQIVLIDYDGMYVNGLPIGNGNEIGHKDFQHPLRSSKEFGPKMDRFSFILIDLALNALIQQPVLLTKFRSGGEAILFKANDFKDPRNSPLFAELAQIPSLKISAENFRAICLAPVDAVPSLRDFLSGISIPASTTGSAQQFVSRVAPVGYIPSYNVLSASDYAVVAAAVGQKVELIGQIVDVKQGIGKRGRGRGRPYVFINFGHWQKDCVKLTIWSEALDSFTTTPNEKLVNQWVSVIGLIDPPYEGAHYGKVYRNVGITIDRESQIERISATEAKYRLGTPKAQSGTGSAPTNNKDLLKGLNGSQSSKTGTSKVTPATPVSRPTTPVSANAAILAGIQTQKTKTSTASASTSRQAQSPQNAQINANNTSGTKNGSSSWIFFVLGGIVLLLLVFAR